MFDTEKEAIPIQLNCPRCGEQHLDLGDFATKLHHTHACQKCGLVWRPCKFFTVGVKFLPGYKNEETKVVVAATTRVVDHPSDGKIYVWKKEQVEDEIVVMITAVRRQGSRWGRFSFAVDRKADLYSMEHKFAMTDFGVVSGNLEPFQGTSGHSLADLVDVLEGFRGYLVDKNGAAGSVIYELESNRFFKVKFDVAEGPTL
jgi:rubredoxin